jgi:hypothetical protein
MGGGGSKQNGETRAKMLAFNAMQEKMQKMEKEIKKKDRVLEIQQQALKSRTLPTESTENATPAVAEVQKTSKTKVRVSKNVNKKRAGELAKISSWSLDAEATQEKPEPVPVPVPEPVDVLLAKMPTPKAATEPVANLLSTSNDAQDHYAKVESHVRAVTAFKNNFEQEMLASRSKMRNRLQKRRSRKLKRASSKDAGSLDQNSNTASTQQTEEEAAEAPPPALPPRPKVSSVEYHSYTFVQGTLGINFEEMIDEPPYAMFVWSVVKGWQGDKQGVQADDVLTELNGQQLEHMSFDNVMQMLLKSSRPMTMKLRRDKYEGVNTSPSSPKKSSFKQEIIHDDDTPPPLPPKLPPRKANSIQAASGVEAIQPS